MKVEICVTIILGSYLRIDDDKDLKSYVVIFCHKSQNDCQPNERTQQPTDRPTIIDKISISIPILFQLNVNRNTKVKSEFMFNVNVTPHHSCSAQKEQTLKESYDVLWNYLCECADNKNQLSMVGSMGGEHWKLLRAIPHLSIF